MKRIAIITLGCKVNTFESEAILKLFLEDGYVQVEEKEIADVYVVNTCTVTNTGDSKSRQMIRRCHKLNASSIICVVGCYSQIDSETVSQIEGVSIVLGTRYRNKLVEYVHEFEETHHQIVVVDDVMKLHEFEDLNFNMYTSNTRAFLKIQDGCNNFCTYCIIPYARGRMRSRNKDSVLHQARELVNHGYKEIVLTGIHTAGYGEDLENYSFYDLLCDLVKIEGLQRLRISSIEMSQVSDEIITLIGHSKVIVDHLHIPIQSGCDEILKKMNRHYTTKEFEEKYFKLKEALPNINITTDVIVGFPTETDQNFEDTYNWIKKLHINQLHVFPYSQRTGTPAAKMLQVDGNIKKQRVNRLIQLSNELLNEYAESFIGKTLEVLIEEKQDNYMKGHASNYLTVLCDPSLNSGDIVRVKIIENNQGILKGIIDEKN